MGPLNGYTVIELAGIGPAPMGAMYTLSLHDALPIYRKSVV